MLDSPNPSDRNNPRDALPGDARAKRRRQNLVLGAVTVVVGVLASVAIINLMNGSDDSTGSGDATATAQAERLAVFPFTNDDGTTGHLSDLEGKPAVVNFFASWCAPCRAEMSDFQAVHLEAADKVQFFGISHDSDESGWRSLVDETGVTFPTAIQSGQEIWSELGLFGMPSTIFITADGRVAATWSGVLNDDKLKELIAEHLAVGV